MFFFIGCRRVDLRFNFFYPFKLSNLFSLIGSKGQEGKETLFCNSVKIKQKSMHF